MVVLMGTVQGLLDWFEVDLGVTELSFIHETYLTSLLLMGTAALYRVCSTGLR